MLNKRQLRVGSVAFELFARFTDVCDVTAMMMTYGGRRTLYRYDFDLESMREDIARRKKREALNTLVRRKYLSFNDISHKVRITFTQKGAQEVLRQKILKAYVLPDDQTCVVVFDIPETHRKLRNQLGRLLDSAGFVRIQRSVWIAQYDTAELLVKLFRTVGLKRSWVRVFLAKEQP